MTEGMRKGRFEAFEAQTATRIRHQLDTCMYNSLLGQKLGRMFVFLRILGQITQGQDCMKMPLLHTSYVNTYPMDVKEWQ